jgi:hypothetical protein
MRVWLMAQGRARRWLPGLSMAGLLMPGALVAAPVSEAHVRCVRSLVQSQIDAFSPNDAERASSCASSGCVVVPDSGKSSA